VKGGIHKGTTGPFSRKKKEKGGSKRPQWAYTFFPKGGGKEGRPAARRKKEKKKKRGVKEGGAAFYCAPQKKKRDTQETGGMEVPPLKLLHLKKKGKTTERWKKMSEFFPGEKKGEGKESKKKKKRRGEIERSFRRQEKGRTEQGGNAACVVFSHLLPRGRGKRKKEKQGRVAPPFISLPFGQGGGKKKKKKLSRQKGEEGLRINLLTKKGEPTRLKRKKTHPPPPRLHRKEKGK